MENESSLFGLDQNEESQIEKFLATKNVEYIWVKNTAELLDYDDYDDNLFEDFEDDDEMQDDVQEAGEIKICKFAHSQEVPNSLPPGYFFTGSVARHILQKELGGENILPPRDIDICGITDLGCDSSLMDEVVKHASDEGRIQAYSLEEYFNSRDFTLNEILADSSFLYCSESALYDLSNHVIRPTEYEYQRFGDYGESKSVRPRIVLKAIRLQSELEYMYGNSEIEGIKDWQFYYENLSLFELALNLEKAYERGDALATRFYVALLKNGTVETGLDEGHIGGKNFRELFISVYFRLEDVGNPFVFRKIPKPVGVELERPIANPLKGSYEYYEALANNYTGSNRFKLDDE